MKKNNTTIIVGTNIPALKDLYKKLNNTNIILINENIINLEKEIKLYKNLIIYPINDKLLTDFQQQILSNIIKHKLKNITSIIIYTTEPKYAKPLENITIKDLSDIFNKNINFTINIIKNYALHDNISITFILHIEKQHKNIFLTANKYINHILTKTMNTINENNTKAKTICISTENIKLKYKNIIYPYKKKKLKDQEKITETYIYLMKKSLNKKLIII